jgi:hypothetical protein
MINLLGFESAFLVKTAKINPTALKTAEREVAPLVRPLVRGTDSFIRKVAEGLPFENPEYRGSGRFGTDGFFKQPATLMADCNIGNITINNSPNVSLTINANNCGAKTPELVEKKLYNPYEIYQGQPLKENPYKITPKDFNVNPKKTIPNYPMFEVLPSTPKKKSSETIPSDGKCRVEKPADPWES